MHGSFREDLGPEGKFLHIMDTLKAVIQFAIIISRKDLKNGQANFLSLRIPFNLLESAFNTN